MIAGIRHQTQPLSGSSPAMSIHYCQVVAPAVLLLLGIVGILLVVLSTEEMRKPPENMVNKRLLPLHLQWQSFLYMTVSR